MSSPVSRTSSTDIFFGAACTWWSRCRWLQQARFFRSPSPRPDRCRRLSTVARYRNQSSIGLALFGADCPARFAGIHLTRPRRGTCRTWSICRRSYWAKSVCSSAACLCWSVASTDRSRSLPFSFLTVGGFLQSRLIAVFAENGDHTDWWLQGLDHNRLSGSEATLAGALKAVKSANRFKSV